MQCELIYYTAHKLGYNGQIINQKLSQAGLELNKAVYAATVKELTDLLSEAIERSNITFIVGELDRADKTVIANILSEYAGNHGSEKPNCKKVTDPKTSSTSFVLQSGKQMIVLLPYEPEKINTLFQEALTKYICDFYGLTPNMSSNTINNQINNTAAQQYQFNPQQVPPGYIPVPPYQNIYPPYVQTNNGVYMGGYPVINGYPIMPITPYPQTTVNNQADENTKKETVKRSKSKKTIQRRDPLNIDTEFFIVSEKGYIDFEATPKNADTTPNDDVHVVTPLERILNSILWILGICIIAIVILYFLITTGIIT